MANSECTYIKVALQEIIASKFRLLKIFYFLLNNLTWRVDVVQI